MNALSRLRAAHERQQSEFVLSLTLDEMHREIERGGLDEGTMKRIRRRFLDLTNPTDHQQAQEAAAA